MKGLTSTTLLLDEQISKANIDRMAAKARQAGVQFRPHFKTHQSHAVGKWFQNAGVQHITVSSLKMGLYFDQDGWKDITIAIPFNVHETELLSTFHDDTTVNIVLMSPMMVGLVDARLQQDVNVMIKIDTGYHRTGIWHEDTSLIREVIEAINTSKHLHFKGFLAHAGHTYNASSVEQIQTRYRECVERMQGLKKQFPEALISVGDTPGCSVTEDLSGVDEVRPGNFVFYDLMMQNLGACHYENIAVCMAVPVVAKHTDELKIVVHGGGVHFSKDFLPQKDGSKRFGKVVQLNETGWSTPIEDLEVVSLSQEHGILKANSKAAFDQVTEGEFLGILPVHSCMTSEAMGEYLTLEGERLDHL